MIVALAVTYNSMSAGILEPFIACFLEQRECAAQLLIIDNGSTDGTADYLEKLKHPKINIVLNGGNIGFSAACNQGIGLAKEAGARHVLFMNHDIEFGPTLLREMIDSLIRSRASALSPAITYFSPRDRVWYAGGRMSFSRGMVTYNDGINGSLSRLPIVVTDTMFAPGCCLLVDVDLFDRVGLFDERFFVYWEDADFCLRMRRLGERLVVDRSIVIFHKVSATTGGPRSDFSLRMYNKNHMLFLRKHFGRGTMMTVLPILAAKAVANLFLRRLSLRQVGVQFRALLEGLFAPMQ